MLQRLAELGAGLPALRTEAEVLRRVFTGLEELELAFAWLFPEDGGLRLGQTFVPPGMVPRDAQNLSGRWQRDLVGQWPPLLARAWREGGAYASELPLEAVHFLEGSARGLADTVRRSLQQAGQPHVIAVRIDVEGQPRAMLALAGDWLREEELPSVRLFGAQVSAALDAALTISRLSAQNTALAALNRLASVTASAPHPRALFGPGTDEIVGLLGCDAMSLLLPMDSAHEIELAYARGLEEGSAERFARHWLASRICHQAQQEGVPVERAVEDCPKELRDELWRQGFHTVVAVPLRVRSRGVGTLGVMFRERRPLTPLERETLQAMGSHFAAAIESHRLLHELRGRAEDMALLHEVAKALATTLELDKLLATGVTSLARIVDTSDAYVLLPSALGERLEIRSLTGGHPEMLGRSLPMLPAYSSLPALAFHSREVVMVEDAESDLRVNQEMRHDAGAKACLVLPLVVHERPVGVIMAVETRWPRRFTPAEMERASAIANQLALAREGARLVEDLKASYVELARTQAQLVRRERLAALGELSAVVAHEVRNPLGAIFNSVASIRRIVGPESPAVPLVDIVSEEADRLNRIVADLLTFARPPAPLPYAVPLSPLVEDAVRGALAEAPARWAWSSTWTRTCRR
ncbi:GAF domain-containing protein [Pyxidicoccus sp. 3LG]